MISIQVATAACPPVAHRNQPAYQYNIEIEAVADAAATFPALPLLHSNDSPLQKCLSVRLIRTNCQGFKLLMRRR